MSEVTITCGGCGHTAPFDRWNAGEKKIQCPNCRRIEKFHDAPATRMASGFVMPGKRTVEVIGGRRAA